MRIFNPIVVQKFHYYGIKWKYYAFDNKRKTYKFKIDKLSYDKLPEIPV